MKMEHSIRYDALKSRWRPLLKQIEKDQASGVRFCPDWLRKRKFTTGNSNIECNMATDAKENITSVTECENNPKQNEFTRSNEARNTDAGDSPRGGNGDATENCENLTGSFDMGVSPIRGEDGRTKAREEKYDVCEEYREFSGVGEKNGENASIGDMAPENNDTCSCEDSVDLVVNVHGCSVENIRDAITEAMLEEPLPEQERGSFPKCELSDKEVKSRDFHVVTKDGCFDQGEGSHLKLSREGGPIVEQPCIGEEIGKCHVEEHSTAISGGMHKLSIGVDNKEEQKGDRKSNRGFCYVVEGNETGSSSLETNNDGEDFLQASKATRIYSQEIGASNEVVCIHIGAEESGEKLHYSSNEDKEDTKKNEEDMKENEEDMKKNEEDMEEATDVDCGRDTTVDTEEPLLSGSINIFEDGPSRPVPRSEKEMNPFFRNAVGYDKEVEESGEQGLVVVAAKCENEDLKDSTSFNKGNKTDLVFIETPHFSHEHLYAQFANDNSNIITTWSENLDCMGDNDPSEMGRLEGASEPQESSPKTFLPKENFEISELDEGAIVLTEDVGLSIQVNFRPDVIVSKEAHCRTAVESDKSFDEFRGNVNEQNCDDSLIEFDKANIGNGRVHKKQIIIESESFSCPTSQHACSDKIVTLKTSEISPIKPCEPMSEDRGQSDESEAKSPPLVPKWLQQQLQASSPAGTKIKRKIRIHEEGLSSMENFEAVVPLKEITEKASLAVQKRLIEQDRVVPRSSTPVEEALRRQPRRDEASSASNEEKLGSRIRITYEDSDGDLKINSGYDTEIIKVDSGHQSLVRAKDTIQTPGFKGQIIERMAKVGNELSVEGDDIVDPETGENGGAKTHETKGRERSSLSSNLNAIENSLQRPLDRSRKAFSTADLNGSWLSGGANEGVFNLLKNLDESISKSDSNVYKASQESSQGSQLSCFEPHDSTTCLYCAARRECGDTAQEYVSTDLKQYIEIQAKVTEKVDLIYFPSRYWRVDIGEFDYFVIILDVSHDRSHGMIPTPNLHLNVDFILRLLQRSK